MPDVDEEEVAPKKSMLPLIIAAVGALVVGVGAGFGGALMMPSGEEDSDSEVAEEDAEPVEIERDGETLVIEDPDGVYIHDLERFTINLRGGGGGRTLRMALQVQSRARHQYDLEDSTPALRDAVLTLASDYTYGDIEGLDGKTRLKDDLLAAVVQVVDRESVERLFFTEFQVN
ncbi:MAG: flagellar basal body-associated protein FliL [Myxococcota bacterium]